MTKDNRKINEHYTEIGEILIANMAVLEPIKNSEAKIIFLESDSKKVTKGKAILGQCEKIASKYKWGIPCDFTITLFKPNIEGLSEAQIEVLLLHELLHVGIDQDSYYIRPHDLEDFKYVVQRYGTDWNL